MAKSNSADVVFSDQPLRLAALVPEDLPVISALVQDAVGSAAQTSWKPAERRLTIMLKRFRWEDSERAEREGRAYERVHSALIIDCAMAVRARGIDMEDREKPLALLALHCMPDEEPPSARLLLALSGGGELAVDVECVDVSLADLTRPWEAHSRRSPDHPLDDEG